jgi:hypothetical protein
MDLLSFFLLQHARVHSADMAGGVSPVDRVFGGLTDEQMRARPSKGLNSPIWLLWHMARTEDVAVNLVVTDAGQVLDDGWALRLDVPYRHMGTGMTDDEVSDLTARADVAAVRAYRSAVGRRTREVVGALAPEAWDEILGLADTSRAAAAGGFGPNDLWVDGVGHKPWQGHSRGTQLASSAIGHNAVHIGEAITVRGLAGYSLGA